MKSKFDWSSIWVPLLASILTLLVLYLLTIHGVTIGALL